MIGVWNIRGINNPIKEIEIANLICKNKLKFLGIIKTRVNVSSFDKSQSVYALYSGVGGDVLLLYCEWGGIDVDPHAADDFKTWVNESSLYELKNVGNRFTWSNNQASSDRIFRKLDWCFVNSKWVDNWTESFYNAQAPGISDHCPLVVQIKNRTGNRHTGFKFFNVWRDHSSVLDIVKRGWDKEVHGHLMFQIAKKLNLMKRDFQVLNRRDFSNISKKVESIRKLAENLSNDLQKDPFNKDLLDEGTTINVYLHKLLSWEESILRQKSRMIWIALGDQNTKYFHRYIKQRQVKNRIASLKIADGNIFDNGYVLTEEDRFMLFVCVTDEEIKYALFDINVDKAPGPDVIDITQAIKDFFRNGNLLKQANSICCNVIYKTISKVLAKRISKILDKVVSKSQSAFIPGRSISDNILLAHELVRNYHRKKGFSCALKVNLHKAYDSAEWDFIEEVMIGMNFPRNFIKLIVSCIISAMFSVQVNGELVGQLGMATKDGSGFIFHKSCKKINLCHLAFAEDLFLFCNRDLNSVKILKETLSNLSKVSGLKPNLNKSSGVLPVRYLGLPLISTKLSKEQCNSLISRITSRIASWSAKCLSYAGRLQLVKASVSLAYDTEKRSSPVKWDDVCAKKSYGGLGIKAVYLWNVAAISKHVWNLVSFKPSFWATWVITNKLKLSSFCGISKPLDSSWSWRGLLKIRPLIAPFFEYILVDGAKFFFWHDPWPNGISIADRFPGVVIKDTEVHKSAKVGILWRNNDWVLPDPIDQSTLNAWDFIKSNFKVNTEARDRVKWKARSNGHIPRFSFISWLAMKDSLMTKDKLKKWKVITSDSCSMCNLHTESHKHQFFECQFSNDVWQKILS
ncbi:uncharacterized protein LOC126677168 [Mercurialis annua]|uniref:uncharacterized protein LOC126677168 n=1 Tax=Mercurialis annua TaxID=3986 RepID=UPI00215F6D59|nr:uncharacterized protein LOC126677168 [Mercurialis annua]